MGNVPCTLHFVRFMNIKKKKADGDFQRRLPPVLTPNKQSFMTLQGHN